ncbi:MAG: putative neutral zinc metallopeptidase [Candidatus Omnitrophica bacterium ADurb.Bin292]|nr:MAG: putative neutral zinc metallopeptidase [Candidatus Omnitrophica bacterium ADurb.Bin292]
MNPLQGLLFLLTVGISFIVVLYGAWVKMKYCRPGFLTAITGSEVARMVLDKMGMFHVSVTPVECPDEAVSSSASEGLFISRKIYDGRDIPSLVRAARGAFLKGQLSNLIFWTHLKKKVTFAAQVTVVLGWICFLAGMLIRNAGFLVTPGLGAFAVVLLLSFYDLSFELDAEDRTSRLMKEARCLEPHEWMCFQRLNRAAALEGLACLVLMPWNLVSGVLRRNRHGI